MCKLSKKAINLLQLAGWSENRSIDITQFEYLFESNGLEFFPLAREFLRRFGNLYLVNTSAIPPAAEDWHFDVVRALKYGSNITPYYGQRLSGDVCPIGMAFREHMLLMMNAEGKVYAGYDQLLLFVGDSGVDAINTLSEGHRLRKLV